MHNNATTVMLSKISIYTEKVLCQLTLSGVLVLIPKFLILCRNDT